MGQILGARADVQDRHDFGDGTHGGPNPSNSLVEHARRLWEAKRGVGCPQNGPEFIELQNRQRQAGKQNGMQGLRMFGGASDPAAQGIGLEMWRVLKWVESSSRTFFGHTFNDAVEDERDFVTWGT